MVAEFILEALKILKPAPRLTVSQWADKNRILGQSESNIPGRWKTENAPYLKGIMDAFTDMEIEEIGICKCTQVGGSEVILNMLGYLIDCAPAPAMIVYPNERLGRFFSENKIKTMVGATPSLKNKFDENSPRMELQFDGMYLIIASAQSPASVGSYPIRYLFMDEVDKYPLSAGKEADPRSLAMERTKTYDTNKKIISVSTPTYEDAPIWKTWSSADIQYEYFVPCPHCGGKQTFQFKNLIFDSKTPEKARDSAVYVCPFCGGVIDDLLKNNMVQRGQWQSVKNIGKSKIAFKINTFYAPWVRLGDIACEFVKSKKDPLKLMNFINSWLAEPFKEVETSVTAEFLMDKRAGTYKNGEIPSSTVFLTGGVDIQKECLYWVIRAWLPNMASFKIANGKAFSFAEVEFIMNKTYCKADKSPLIVNLCCVDSGNQTDDVYNFCAINHEWAVPCKGSSVSLPARYKKTVIEKENSKANGLLLYTLDTNYYKDMIYARLHRGEDEGGWFVGADCSPEYAEMLVAEHKVRKKFNNRQVAVWEPKAAGRDNHYFDCEVYAALGADLCGLRMVNTLRARENFESKESGSSQQAEENSNENGGWFSDGFRN